MRVRIFTNFTIGILLAGSLFLSSCRTAEAPQMLPNGITGGIIALTFDDGPFAYTDRFLLLLESLDLRATFFVIGEHVQNHPEQARRVFEAGHEIGNHSWSHINLGGGSGVSLEAVRQELADTSAIIEQVTGAAPVFFRAPFLSHGQYLSQVSAELGMAKISSNILGMDWEDISPQQIANHVLGAAADGGIILLHEQWDEGNLRTELALPIIVNELRARGFEIVTLGELVQRKGVTLVPGEVYSAIN